MVRLKTVLTSARIAIRAETLLFGARVQNLPRAMHHGLQRSGTNYLLMSLLRQGVPVVNYRDPTRSDPRHKHCRWQHDKSTLIPPIAAQYGNSLMVKDVDELDGVCGLSNGTRHIVITKDKDEWLKSICNWGLRCGWFTRKADALAALPRLLRDYEAFNEFWKRLSFDAPDRVALLKLQTLTSEPRERTLAGVCDRLGLPSKPALGPLIITDIPQSPRSRMAIIGIEDVRAALNLPASS